MRRAIELAREAEGWGDVPIGAVCVTDGVIIGEGANRREADEDPTAHAEVVALRAAARHVGRWRLDGVTLYVTLEPCAMCAGALVNARVARVVFGARDPRAGAVETLFSIVDDVRLNHRLVWRGGVLQDECVGLLQAFFRSRRGR